MLGQAKLESEVESSEVIQKKKENLLVEVGEALDICGLSGYVV